MRRKRALCMSCLFEFGQSWQYCREWFWHLLLKTLFISSPLPPPCVGVTMYASAGGKAKIMTQGIHSLLLHVSSLQLKHSELLGASHLMDCHHFGPCFYVSVDQVQLKLTQHTGS